MTDVHDIAVLHDVLFALETESSLGSCRSFAARREQVIPANRFGTDEVVLEVGVNCPRRLR